MWTIYCMATLHVVCIVSLHCAIRKHLFSTHLCCDYCYTEWELLWITELLFCCIAMTVSTCIALHSDKHTSLCVKCTDSTHMPPCTPSPSHIQYIHHGHTISEAPPSPHTHTHTHTRALTCVQTDRRSDEHMQTHTHTHAHTHTHTHTQTHTHTHTNPHTQGAWTRL